MGYCSENSSFHWPFLASAVWRCWVTDWRSNRRWNYWWSCWQSFHPLVGHRLLMIGLTVLVIAWCKDWCAQGTKRIRKEFGFKIWYQTLADKVHVWKCRLWQWQTDLECISCVRLKHFFLFQAFVSLILIAMCVCVCVWTPLSSPINKNKVWPTARLVFRANVGRNLLRKFLSLRRILFNRHLLTRNANTDEVVQLRKKRNWTKFTN